MQVETLSIRGLMNPDQAQLWYLSNTKHFDESTGKLATGLPGKPGRYLVRVLGKEYWVFYSLLYSPSRGYTFTTGGQILVKREFVEDQGIMFIASDYEPQYISDHTLVLPSGYRQKVRISYCLKESLNILRIKKRKGE